MEIYTQGRLITKGELITHGVILQRHEFDTVNFLVRMGKSIELLKPSFTPNNRMPDFLMDGIMWEMKSPQGKEPRTVEHAFKNAAKQSENIVIDLRRTKLTTSSAVKMLEKRFNLSRHVKRLLAITREENLVDFRKKSC